MTELTYEQIEEIEKEHLYNENYPVEGVNTIAFARAVIAADRALRQVEQEPVAWLYRVDPWFDGDKWHEKFEATTSERVAEFKGTGPAIPLYTTPKP
jgi:hypothetical protein